jgi:hypothetical protein
MGALKVNVGTAAAPVWVYASSLAPVDYAWIALPYLTVYTSNANRWGQVPGYRKIGDRVELRGTIRNATTTNFTNGAQFAQLPVGFRPPGTCYWYGVSGNGTVRLNCGTDGIIYTDQMSPDSWADLGCYSFSLTP